MDLGVGAASTPSAHVQGSSSSLLWNVHFLVGKMQEAEQGLEELPEIAEAWIEVPFD